MFLHFLYYKILVMQLLICNNRTHSIHNSLHTQLIHSKHYSLTSNTTHSLLTLLTHPKHYSLTPYTTHSLQTLLTHSKHYSLTSNTTHSLHTQLTLDTTYRMSLFTPVANKNSRREPLFYSPPRVIPLHCFIIITLHHSG